MSGSARFSSSASHVPCKSSVSPTAITVSSSWSSPFRWTASTTRSPLSVTMPGKTRSPIRPERGGITTSAAPEWRVSSSVACGSSAYCSISVRACRLKSGGVARAARSGRRRSAEEHDDDDRGGDERHADEREVEVAEAPDARVGRRLRDDHVDGRPRQCEQRSGVSAERHRQEELGRRAAEPDRHQDDDRQQRRDGAVDADQRCEDRDQQQHQHEEPCAARPDPADQLLPRPGRHSRRVERLADDEERRDEDDRRVAEACECLVETEHAGRPERERDTERDDRDGEVIPDEDDDGRAEHEEGDRAVAHALQRPHAADARHPVWTGDPGPSGIPIRYHATKNSVQRTLRMTTYGSMIATTVPIPASFR